MEMILLVVAINRRDAIYDDLPKIAPKSNLAK